MSNIKKEDLINQVEQYKKENKLLQKELNQIKEYLNQYKKENELLQKKYDKATKSISNSIKVMNAIEKRAERELEEKLSKYKKLGRKQYNNDSTIKLMYYLYINQLKSFKDIADNLNKKGIKTKLNKDWGKSSISCIMKNEKNINKYLDKEQTKKFIELLESNKRNIKKK